MVRIATASGDGKGQFTLFVYYGFPHYRWKYHSMTYFFFRNYDDQTSIWLDEVKYVHELLYDIIY